MSRGNDYSEQKLFACPYGQLIVNHPLMFYQGVRGLSLSSKMLVWKNTANTEQTVIFLSLQCGRWGKALRHQQDTLRLRLRRAVQSVQLAERTRTSLPAHVFGPAQWLSECYASVPSLYSAETVRTSACDNMDTKEKASWELEEIHVLGLCDLKQGSGA